MTKQTLTAKQQCDECGQDEPVNSDGWIIISQGEIELTACGPGCGEDILWHTLEKRRNEQKKKLIPRKPNTLRRRYG